MKTKTLLLVGGAGILIWVMLNRAKAAGQTSIVGGSPVLTNQSIGQQVGAGVAIGTGLITSLKNLFSGTTQPLSSGIAPSNTPSYGSSTDSLGEDFQDQFAV